MCRDRVGLELILVCFCYFIHTEYTLRVANGRGEHNILLIYYIITNHSIIYTHTYRVKHVFIPTIGDDIEVGTS